MADSFAASVASLLLQTLEIDKTTRQAAQDQLEAGETTAGFTISLLQLVSSNEAEVKVRQLAATYFKNVVRKHWNEPEYSVISAEDRALIKSNLVALMATVPPIVQRQLSEALAIISKRDFPEEWPTLLPELVARLRTPDVSVVNGVLETANSIFERFRDAPNTDPVRAVLRICLDAFATPLLETYTSIAGRVEQGASVGESRDALAPYLLALRLCTSIYYSLSWLEVPDVFADAISDWMTHFRNFITFSGPSLMAAEDETNEGPLESLQGAILDVIALYADKHDEDFEPFFPTFAGDVWTLLSGSTTDRIMAMPMDALVVKAVKFLAASVAKAIHVDFFAGDGVLEAVCEKVVVPNIAIRQAELDLFEENPLEFVRQDIEGSDSDTRRRVASDLVRNLLKHFEDRATTALTMHINSLLESYESNREANYLSKDTAIALLIALTVKAQVASTGATNINPLVNLGEYLTMHILPEMDATSINDRPIVKAACIKFIATFRAQFTAEHLTALLPMLIPFTGSSNFVVHTYAATAIERLLLVRDRVVDGTRVTYTPRLDIGLVAAHLVPLFTALFGLMTNPSYVENEYLMRTLMRVVAFVKDAVAPYTSQVIDGLTLILARACANPANPIYSHMLFETLAALMKNVCSARPDALAAFEAMVFPPFQQVLKDDIAEFHPYVFQLLALLLELRPAPAPGTSALTPAFETLLPPLLTADLWQRSGNVPALTSLLQAYLRRGAAFFVSSNNMLPLLGIWQNLFSLPNKEEHSFEIISALFEGATIDAFSSYLGQILSMIVEKLHATKSLRMAKGFCHSSGILIGFHGPEVFASALESISVGLFYQCVEHILATQAPKLTGKSTRQETAIGLTRLLTETPSLLEDPSRHSAFSKLLACIVELLEPAASHVSFGPEQTTFVEETDALETLDNTSDYSAAFAKLAFAQDPNRNAFTSAGDPKVFLGSALCKLSTAFPGLVASLVAASPVQVTINKYVEAAAGRLA